jgi:hypothetical protein
MIHDADGVSRNAASQLAGAGDDNVWKSRKPAGRSPLQKGKYRGSGQRSVIRPRA